jgi:putative ABC transport system ATP-binding protein
VLKHILLRDRKFFSLIAIYGVIVALLNLALPLSVQVLITTIIYTALISPIVILGIVLLALISFSAILSVLQKSLIEVYKRSSFVRLASDILLKAIDSDYTSFRAHNTSDLSSRYFEIFNIQNYAADLIVEGLLVILTIIVSFILSSFYHPYFLILNIVIIACIWLSWSLVAKRATQRSIERSEAKFAVFAWIDDIFRMSRFFKGTKNRNYAMEKGHRLIEDYIQKRTRYWHLSFVQLVILTALYVIVTILLITFGSVLVIKGQLSLGQLVAAEILYTNSLYGVAKLNLYYDKYFSLIASADEMSHLFMVENEVVHATPNLGRTETDPAVAIIRFNQVHYRDAFGTAYTIDFTIKPKCNSLILTQSQNLKGVMVNLLNNLEPADHGYVEYTGIHVADIDPQQLRDAICIIDNANMFGCTIHEFLHFGVSEIMTNQINDVLTVVGLNQLINQLPERSATMLIGDGYPLLEQHIILLKIAKAILFEAPVVLITEVFDKVDKPIQQQILSYFTKQSKATLVCFSENKDHHVHFDHFIYLTDNASYVAHNSHQFRQIIKSLGSAKHE